MNIQRLFYILIRLPSTIIYESLHTIPLLIFIVTDRILNILRALLNMQRKLPIVMLSYNVIPDFKEGTLGYVKYQYHSNFQQFFISIAPISAWFFIPIAAYYFGFIDYDFNVHNYDFLDNITINGSHSFSLKDVLFIPITILLFRAGILSEKDIINAHSSMFEVDFLSQIALISILAFLYISVDFKDKSAIEIYAQLSNIVVNSIKDIILFIQ